VQDDVLEVFTTLLPSWASATSPKPLLSQTVCRHSREWTTLDKQEAFKEFMRHWLWWCTPVILATWEAEVGGSQSKAGLDKTMKPYHPKRAWGCGPSCGAPAWQAQGPEFNPQYHQKEKETQKQRMHWAQSIDWSVLGILEAKACTQPRGWSHRGRGALKDAGLAGPCHLPG
jgi:hypothetical protein